MKSSFTANCHQRDGPELLRILSNSGPFENLAQKGLDTFITYLLKTAVECRLKLFSIISFFLFLFLLQFQEWTSQVIMVFWSSHDCHFSFAVFFSLFCKIVTKKQRRNIWYFNTFDCFRASVGWIATFTPSDLRWRKLFTCQCEFEQASSRCILTISHHPPSAGDTKWGRMRLKHTVQTIKQSTQLLLRQLSWLLVGIIC